MNYQIIPEEKLVCLWDEDAAEDTIRNLQKQGYRVAYFVRGANPSGDALRSIALSRC